MPEAPSAPLAPIWPRGTALALAAVAASAAATAAASAAAAADASSMGASVGASIGASGAVVASANGSAVASGTAAPSTKGLYCVESPESEPSRPWSVLGGSSPPPGLYCAESPESAPSDPMSVSGGLSPPPVYKTVTVTATAIAATPAVARAGFHQRLVVGNIESRIADGRKGPRWSPNRLSSRSHRSSGALKPGPSEAK